MKHISQLMIISDFFFDLSSFVRDLQSRKSPSLPMGWTQTMTIYNSLPPILKMKSQLPIQLRDNDNLTSSNEQFIFFRTKVKNFVNTPIE